LPDRLGRFEQTDRVAQALGHLGLAVESQDAPRLGEQRLGLGEKAFAVARVPAPGYFPHQLEVLYLILSYRHEASFIEQYVSRLQHGVREYSHRDAFLPLRFVFVLSLALELAQRRDAGQQPIQLGVRGDVRLDEDDAPLRIEPGGVQADRHVDRELRQRGRVVRLSNGVQIDDTEQTLVLGLQPHPVLDGAEVVADVEFAGRLDAAEYASHGGHGATRCVNTTT